MGLDVWASVAKQSRIVVHLEPHIVVTVFFWIAVMVEIVPVTVEED